VEGQGVIADLHLLKSHPLCERVLEAATSNPSIMALSHEASIGDIELRDGRVTITRVGEVSAVALVAQAATNRGLFEDLVEPRATAPPPQPGQVDLSDPQDVADAFRSGVSPLVHDLPDAMLGRGIVPGIHER
jgi:hypothetical protein